MLSKISGEELSCDACSRFAMDGAENIFRIRDQGFLAAGFEEVDDRLDLRGH